MATALVPHVSPTMEGIVYPATPTTRYVNDSVKIGTNKHQLDARLLTTESAIKEALENVLGHVSNAVALGASETVFETFLSKICDTDFLFSFSNTNCPEAVWSHIFDQRPKFDAAEKNHTNSIFNHGMKLGFEKLTASQGDLFVLIQSDLGDGTVEHKIGRYGGTLDRSLDNEEMMKIQMPWDVVNKRVRDDRSGKHLTELAAESKLDDDSRARVGANINKLFEIAMQKASAHNATSWFCSVIGPLAEVPRATSGPNASHQQGLIDTSRVNGPVLELKPDGGLYITDSRGEMHNLRSLYASSYVPCNSALAEHVDASIRNVAVYVQDHPVDFSGDSVYSRIGATPNADGSPKHVLGLESDIIEVVMDYKVPDGASPGGGKTPMRPTPGAVRETHLTYGDDGVVAYMTYCTFTWPRSPSDADVPYGVLVATKDSNRFMNTDPKAFYRDELGDSKYTKETPKSRLFDRLLHMNSLRKSVRKINHRDLQDYMDQPPSFTAAQWNEFWAACTTLDDGMQRLYRAIGMGCVATVCLNVTPDLDYPKSHFVKPSLATVSDGNEADDAEEAAANRKEASKPPPPALIGAIYRTLVNELFWAEYNALPSQQAKQRKRSGSALVEELEDTEEEEGEPMAKRPAIGTPNGAASSSNDAASASARSQRHRRETQRLGLNDPNDATQGGTRRKKSQSERNAAKKTVKASVKKGSALIAKFKQGTVAPQEAIAQIEKLFQDLERASNDL